MNFTIGQRQVELFSNNTDAPLILLQADHNEGEEVWEACQALNCPDFSLAAINNINWEHDLSPWSAPALFKRGTDFTGGADAYLRELEESILPEILSHLDKSPSAIYLAGYSLAGLFALYAAYQTDCFDGMICASGSMWYPNLMTFVNEHEISKRISSVYFSVGDKEAKTKNPIMQTVEENTRQIEKNLNARGVTTTFELNPGGHFQDDAKRVAKGILWSLQMKFDLRELTLSEMAEIYESSMIEAFPEEELKPMKRIEEMYHAGIYHGYGLFVGNALCAYGYFVKNPDTRDMLLDYLAVPKEKRGQGYGSQFLAQLPKMTEGAHVVLFEIEHPEKTAERELYALRKEREAFYLKNQVQMTEAEACVFGVEYRILQYRDGEPLTKEEVLSALNTIYHTMFPKKWFGTQVIIY